jgi:hypothetical protein
VAISAALTTFYLLLRSPRFARDDTYLPWFDRLTMSGYSPE